MRGMKTFLMFLYLCLAGVVSARACLHCGTSDGTAQSERLHNCLSLSFGAKHATEDNHVSTNGLLLGLAHNSMPAEDVMRAFIDERCDLNGVAIELFALTNAGTLRGLSIATILSSVSEVKGAQVTLLANGADTLSGAQIGLVINRTEQEVRGLQLGLLNLAGDLTGVQIGLLNINRDGWVLPLINISW